MSLHTWMLKNRAELWKHVSVLRPYASRRPGVFLFNTFAIIRGLCDEFELSQNVKKLFSGQTNPRSLSRLGKRESFKFYFILSCNSIWDPYR